MSAINIEAMLLNWSETANGGAKIVLQLADPDDLEPFRRMTLAKGKRAGQRLGCAFVEIGDDEKPVERRIFADGSSEFARRASEGMEKATAPLRRGAGPLAQLAGRWCAHKQFQTWVSISFPSICNRLDSLGGVAGSADDYTAAVVRQVCGVASRAELDTDPNAGRSFHKLIREPYHAWLGTTEAQQGE